jgi:hypothetical protein
MNSYGLLQQYKKPLFIFGAIILFVIALFLGFDFYKKQTMGTLIIDGGPPGFSMFIDQTEYKDPTKLYLKPGEYTLKFGRLDFSNYQKTVVLKKGETKTVYVALYATTQAGRDFLAKRPALQAELERIGGLMDRESTDELVKKYPLIARLPVKAAVSAGGTYEINYDTFIGSDSSQTLNIRITASTPIAKKAALKWIKDTGFNPDDYSIYYIDPLKPTGHD